MKKTIVITGANSGIGEALALAYADSHITLGLVARDPDRLKSIKLNCEDKGSSVYTGEIDVTDRNALSNWLQAFDKHHSIDVIIANAGIISSLKNDDLIEQQETVQSIFDTNFFACINTVHSVLDSMVKRRKGSVVLISSLSAYRGIPIYPAYSASKSALKSYFEALRGRLARYGITVTIVTPSFIHTPMTQNSEIPGLFLTDVDKTALIIKRAIEDKSPLVSFPLPHVFSMNLLRVLLPEKFSDWLLLKLFKI